MEADIADNALRTQARKKTKRPRSMKTNEAFEEQPLARIFIAVLAQASLAAVSSVAAQPEALKRMVLLPLPDSLRRKAG